MNKGKPGSIDSGAEIKSSAGIISDHYPEESFFRMCPDLLGIIQHGVISYINPAWEKVLGHKTEDLINLPLTELVHPDDIEIVEYFLNKNLSKDKAEYFSCRLRCRNNSYKFFDIQCTTGSYEDNFHVSARETITQNASIANKGVIENRLTDTTNLLNSTFEILDVGILITDEEGQIVDLNDTTIKMTGITRDSKIDWRTLNQKWTTLNTDLQPFPPEECPFNLSIVERKIVRNTIVGIVTPDSHIKWISINAAPLNNTVKGAVLTLTDITVNKQAEDALRRNETMFRSVFELPLLGIALVSHDMVWARVNRAMANMLGYTAEEFKTVSWDKMILPEDMGPDMIRFRKALSGELDSWNITREMVKKTGERIWTIMSAACVRKPDKSADYFVVMIQDFSRQKLYENEISELNSRLESMVKDRTIELSTTNSILVREIITRKKVEDELLKINSRLRLAQESVKAGVWELEVETKNYYWSEEFYKIFEIEPHCVPCLETLRKRIHPDDRESTINNFSHFLKTSQRFELRCRILTPENDIRWIKTHGTVVTKDNKPVRLVGLCMDITDEVTGMN